jgi:hypothetical protein
MCWGKEEKEEKEEEIAGLQGLQDFRDFNFNKRIRISVIPLSSFGEGCGIRDDAHKEGCRCGESGLLAGSPHHSSLHKKPSRLPLQ